MVKSAELYETDFWLWTQEQAARLRRTAELRPNLPEALDWGNLAAEVESLGSSLSRELLSRYRVLLAHLLKWLHQPARRSRSWRATIRTQRDEIESLLDGNSSLAARREEQLHRAYPKARALASDETGLPPETFPAECPFALEQVEDHDFLPSAPES